MKYLLFTFAALLIFSGTVFAQTASTPPVLYDQNGAIVDGYDAATNSLAPGWYYDEAGSPRYYYANGVYYDPSSQSYGGSVAYPEADGPQSMITALTPGVPNTGMGNALTAWLALVASAMIAIIGVGYLARAR